MKKTIKPIIKLDDGDLEKIKEKLFYILCEFDDFCKKNHLTYYLLGGTLLGAVRHKGFIPWDDDIDVAMPYGDYIRFINMDPHSISDKLFIQSYKSDSEFLMDFAKVRLNDTVFKEYVDQLWNIHHGIYIDVFPLSGVPDDPKERKRYFKVTDTLYNYRYGDLLTPIYSGVKHYLSHLYHRIRSGRYFFLSPKQGALKKIKYVENHPYLDSQKVMCGVYYPGIPIVDRADYGEPVDLEFEGRMFPCPHNWDHNLKQYIGDYMSLPPEEDRVPHHMVVEFDLGE